MAKVNSPYKSNTTIGYKDVFDDFESVSIQELLSDIPTYNSLEVVGFLQANLHLKSSKNQDFQLLILKQWAGKFSEQLRSQLSKKVKGLLGRPSLVINLVNGYASMIFAEQVLVHSNDLERLHDLSSEQELNLFKAYLLCNQKWIDAQPGLNGRKIDGPNSLCEIFLPSNLQFLEFEERKDFKHQCVKAIHFFRFCEADEQFKVYLEYYLNTVNVESWQLLLYRQLEMYLVRFKENDRPSSISIIPAEHEEVRDFLDVLCINEKTIKPTKDFLQFREFPVYRLEEGSYVFLNLNFLVDKIYQGIQFQFAKILSESDLTFNEKPIKKARDFLGIFGAAFAEVGLFYQIMESAFSRYKYKRFTGETLKPHFPNGGEPDYYIRDKGKVYIIEFKNVTFNGEIKHSNDFDKVKNELFHKMVADSKGNSEGITQLREVIEKFRNGDFDSLDRTDFENNIIYPIIVYNDNSFGCLGVNSLLREEFNNQLESNKVKGRDKIKPLTLIALDDLIQYEGIISSKRLTLNHIINKYNEFSSGSMKVVRRDNLFNSLSSVNFFLDNYMSNLNLGSPKIFDEELRPILREQSEKARTA